MLRRKGIGSLPSATNTACSARSRGLPTGAELFGIAQYIPASAIAVSTISTVLFIGEFSEAQISRPAKYKPRVIYMRVGAVDNYKFSNCHKTSGKIYTAGLRNGCCMRAGAHAADYFLLGFGPCAGRQAAVLPDSSLTAVACHASGYPGGC